MSWRIEGDVVGLGSRGDEQNTVSPAVRTAVKQRIDALTHIGTRALTWIKQGVINVPARSLEFEATFEGDITAAHVEAFAIAIYGQSPIRGSMKICESETSATWFEIGVGESGWRASVYTKPPTVTRLNGSRSSW